MCEVIVKHGRRRRHCRRPSRFRVFTTPGAGLNVCALHAAEFRGRYLMLNIPRDHHPEQRWLPLT